MTQCDVVSVGCAANHSKKDFISVAGAALDDRLHVDVTAHARSSIADGEAWSNEREEHNPSEDQRTRGEAARRRARSPHRPDSIERGRSVRGQHIMKLGE